MTPIHDEKAHRFVLAFPEGDAVLDYELRGKGIDFTHTFVPTALRGRSVGEALVKAGLAWARQRQFSVEASCSYVAHYLKRHPEA